MKTKFFLFGLFSLLTITACNHRQERYLDLTSNEYVELNQESETGRMLNAETGEPVSLYVDTRTEDTVYVFEGEKEIVNGNLRRDDDGEWIVKIDGDEYKTKSNGATVKIEGEEYKYESENGAKVKIEGDEYKSKNGNYSIKRDGDGDVKIENGRTQTKIDGETGERKVKKDRNITDKVKKVFKDDNN